MTLNSSSSLFIFVHLVGCEGALGKLCHITYDIVNDYYSSDQEFTHVNKIDGTYSHNSDI